MEDNTIEDENIRLLREVKRCSHETGLLHDEVARLTQKVETLTQVNANLEQVQDEFVHHPTRLLTYSTITVSP